MKPAYFVVSALLYGSILSASAHGATPIVPPLNGATSGTWQYLTLSDGFNYDVLLPYGYSTNYTYPVVLYLHGVGTEAPPGTPPYNAFPLFINSTSVQGVNYRADYPAIVVAPQCANSAFGTNDWGGTNVILHKHKLVNVQDAQCGEDAMTALKDVIAAYSANPEKIYLTGYSMGGFGTYFLYVNNLNLFAAATPVSGSLGGQVTEKQIEHLLLTSPLWAFHGFNDTTVSKLWDETMYTRSQKRHGVMQYIEFIVTGDQTTFPSWLENQDGDGHANADTSAFENTLTMNWLFAQNHP